MEFGKCIFFCFYCFSHCKNHMLLAIDNGSFFVYKISLQFLQFYYNGRFISDCNPTTHHCILYNRVGWSSLLIRREMHWHLIIYKAILGMLPSYLCCLIKQKIVEKYFIRSQNCYTLSVPFVRSELYKSFFTYAAPTDCNLLQSNLKLQNLQSLDHFKTVIRQMKID